jgi:hypothetical protein
MQDRLTSQAMVTAIDAELKRNQDEIDFLVAVISRGGPDASACRTRLDELESQRGDLLTAREDARYGRSFSSEGPTVTA